MKTKHAAPLPRSIYIVLISAFVANIIATYVIMAYFM